MRLRTCIAGNDYRFSGVVDSKLQIGYLLHQANDGIERQIIVEIHVVPASFQIVIIENKGVSIPPF